MRIVVKGSDANINLVIPTSLLCSGIAVRLIAGHCTEKKDKQFYEQVKAMAKELNRFRKKHKGWMLVEVESEGEKVLIKL